jgi:hypothetical protein
MMPIFQLGRERASKKSIYYAILTIQTSRLVFEAKDIQKAKEFASPANLREAMQNAGVVDKPDIYFLG